MAEIAMVTSVKDTTPITRSISSVTQTLCDFVASSLAMEKPKVVSSRTSNTGNRSYKNLSDNPVIDFPPPLSLFSVTYLPIINPLLIPYQTDKLKACIP
jgi:hypothetical protein